MKIIAHNEVELTPGEMLINDRFHELLDQGHGIQGALEIVQGNPNVMASIDPAFWEWLAF